jgi:hypothetical protein
MEPRRSSLYQKQALYQKHVFMQESQPIRREKNEDDQFTYLSEITLEYPCSRVGDDGSGGD